MKTEEDERSGAGWRVGRPYVKTSGVWKPCTGVFVNSGGSWKPCSLRQSECSSETKFHVWGWGYDVRKFLSPSKMQGDIGFSGNGERLFFPTGNYRIDISAIFQIRNPWTGTCIYFMAGDKPLISIDKGPANKQETFIVENVGNLSFRFKTSMQYPGHSPRPAVLDVTLRSIRIEDLSGHKIYAL